MEKEQYAIMRRLEDSLWWYVGMRRITASLLPPVPARDRLVILDAGCGTGATLDFLAQRGMVVGLDIADEALQHCLGRGQHNVAKGSVEHLPFASDSFDLVTSFDVIYHKAVGDDLAVLREFYRVLRPGGMALLRVPAYNWLRGAHDIAVHTRHRYSGSELREKLTAAGFRVSRLTHANCLLLPLAIVKRLAERKGAALATDLSEPRRAVNSLLTMLLGVEGRLLRGADLPCGLSLIGIGIKECRKSDGHSGFPAPS